MTLMDSAKSLFDGVTEDDLTHIPEPSVYNHNYYTINGNLLYAVSDDDNFTIWYWVRYKNFFAIGGSYCSEGDKIMVGEEYTT